MVNQNGCKYAERNKPRSAGRETKIVIPLNFRKFTYRRQCVYVLIAVFWWTSYNKNKYIKVTTLITHMCIYFAVYGAHIIVWILTWCWLSTQSTCFFPFILHSFASLSLGYNPQHFCFSYFRTLFHSYFFTHKFHCIESTTWLMWCNLNWNIYTVEISSEICTTTFGHCLTQPPLKKCIEETKTTAFFFLHWCSVGLFVIYFK